MASFKTLSFFFTTLLVISHAFSQCTPSQQFSNNKIYNHCSDLSQLSSSLHWSFDSTLSTLDIAFVAPPSKPDGWISWAINPTGDGMVGAQSFVAFKDSSGSISVKTFNLKTYSQIVPGNLSFDVTSMSADYVGANMRIFATIKLPQGLMTVNQVWQVGSAVNNGFPAVHDFGAANLNSKGTLDLLQGKSSASSGSSSGSRKRNIHAILNVVSWGIMFPLGILIARYVKAFSSPNPAWFYSHVICQCSAYIIGVAGWGTGMKLGSQSKGVTYSTHLILGISLFTLATVQVCALLLRPKKDHKYRWCWNAYHYLMGHAIIVLGIVNIFIGFDILQPDQKYKIAYIVIISILGAVAAGLEVIKFFWLKKKNDSTKHNVSPDV